MSATRRYLAILTVVCLTAMAAPAAANEGLRVFWVDVEGGAATLFITPAGESILIDTGYPGGRDARRVAALAQTAGLERIDHLIVTHWHLDHYGAAHEIADLIPIARVYDDGDDPPARSGPAEEYLAFRERTEHIALTPGDAIPLEQADGSPELTMTLLGVTRRFIEPGDEHEPNDEALCDDPPRQDPDPSANADSTVFVIRLGDFDFLHTGDLTWNMEEKLVCPVNLVGDVDVYQVGHHGLDSSNNPLLIRSVAPTIAVMNNGETKGCGPQTFTTLAEAPSIEAIYQVHENLRDDREHNTAPERIANHTPAAECDGHPILLRVAPDGGSYTLRIPSTGYSATYPSKPR